MSKKQVTPRQVLLLCTFAYASIYLARHNLSVASPLLISDGHMTMMQIGLMGSIFFSLYAAGQLINGYIGDILSPKMLLITGLALIAAANLGISALPAAGVIIALWGVNALAQSMLWGPSLRLVNEAYKDTPKLKGAVVVLSTSIGIGSLLGIALASLCSKIGTWAVFAAPGAVVGVICLLMMRLPRENIPAAKTNWKQAFKLFGRKDILCMLIPAFGHGMIKENLVLWAPLLFLRMYDIDLAQAAVSSFILPGATLIGRLVYPLAERLFKGNELAVSLGMFALCVLCLVPFFFARLPIAITALLLALAMLGVSIINVAFMGVIPMRYSAQGQISMTAGLLDAAAYLGSAAGSALFAFVIGRFGHIPMIGIYILICLISTGSMLPILKEKAA